MLASLALLLGSTPAFSQTSSPNTGADNRIPLVVLRFSQPDMRFESALTAAVKKAIEAKSDVVFDVVVRPALASETAQINVSRVSSVIQSVGVSPSRISSAATPNSGSRFDEVYVFVR